MVVTLIMADDVATQISQKAVRLLQQSDGALRFGKHGLQLCLVQGVSESRQRADSGSFRTVPRHFSLKYESIPAEKCLAQHENPSLLDTLSASRCTLTERPPKRKFFL